MFPPWCVFYYRLAYTVWRSWRGPWRSATAVNDHISKRFWRLDQLCVWDPVYKFGFTSSKKSIKKLHCYIWLCLRKTVYMNCVCCIGTILMFYILAKAVFLFFYPSYLKLLNLLAATHDIMQRDGNIFSFSGCFHTHTTMTFLSLYVYNSGKFNCSFFL